MKPKPRRLPSRLARAGSSLVFDVPAVRRVDALAVSRYAIPSLVLMENAARAVADAAMGSLRRAPSPVVVILAGPGNNGGDGLAAARHLHNRGVRVKIILALPDRACRGDCIAQLRTLRAMGLRIEHGATAAARALRSRPGVVIDALLGTGSGRVLSGPIAACVSELNRAGANGWRVLAVDLPTGMDAQSGLPLSTDGPVVKADTTVTFCGLKAGMLLPSAAPFLGNVQIADIGVPMELLRRLGRPFRGLRASRAHPRPHKPKRTGNRYH